MAIPLPPWGSNLGAPLTAIGPLNHPERVQKAWGFPFWAGI